MPRGPHFWAQRALVLPACWLVAVFPASCAEAPTPAPRTPGVEDEVVENVREQSAGPYRVGDLGMSDEFLCRVADRIIRSTWQERYQSVSVEGAPAPAPAPPAAWAEPPADPPFVQTVAPPPQSSGVRAYRALLREGRPELRGYRIPLLGQADDLWPHAAPPRDAGPRLAAAAALVARDLDQGLLETAVRVLDELGPESMIRAGERELALLRSVGLPVDWLAHFAPRREPAGPAGALTENGRALAVVHELSRLRAADPEAPPNELASRLRFRFRPSREGFRAASESGDHEAGSMRLQLTRGDHFEGAGDGGSVDIAQQLIARLPTTEFLISIERRFEATLQRTAASWAETGAARVQLLVEDQLVSQWAQDNGKAGTLGFAGTVRPATLVPRYASRREDGSELIPTESFLQETVAHTGHPVIQSPLLFQGGDLLLARHPASGERLLFLGEAELWRNEALGLEREQVLAAFRAEFGADRTEVLPSLSFHLDFDVSFRAVGQDLVAFVNDPEAAARILARRGVETLVAAGVLPAAGAADWRGLLERGAYREFVMGIAGPLMATQRPDQTFPGAVAAPFGERDLARAAADFQRFLLALDVLAEPTLTEGEIGEGGHRGAYFRSLRRTRESREDLRRRLLALGLVVVSVPGISEGSRSICYVNGVHTRSRFLMPAYGGAYEDLDRSAEQAFARALGDAVEIVRVRSAETQRRMGGVHCAVATYPPAAGGGN